MSQGKRSGGPIGGLLKGAGFVIGLATEVHAHNKAKKTGSQNLKQQEKPKIAVLGEIHPGDDVSPPTYDQVITFNNSIDARTSTQDEKQTVNTLVAYNGKSPYDAKPACSDKSLYLDTPVTMQPLPFPVIVPQRRPNDKSRGFARAYAPDLAKYKGIDEATFLNFLKQFHKSSQASGWFTVINIAAMGAGFAPGVIALTVTTSVQVAATVGAEAQRQYRPNSFLDKANEDLFHPRNLHCMVMTFKPEASDTAVLSMGTDNSSSAGPSSALSKFTSNVSNTSSIGGSNSFSLGGQKFRKSDGVTEGEFAIPQAAELVFPSPAASTAGETTPPDSTITDENGMPIANPEKKKKESSWKSTGRLLADYQDRRAQAKFAATYGDDSKLAVPGAMDSSRFASKFSDPNANPLDFLSAARGGGRGRDRSQSRSRFRDHLRRGEGDYDTRYEGERYPDGRRSRERHQRRGGDRDRSQNGRGGLFGGVKSFLGQDLLYLLIAEIPSEEEMRRLMM